MNLKKIGKVFTSKFVGTGPPSYKKRIYLAAFSQRLRNTGLMKRPVFQPLNSNKARGMEISATLFKNSD